MGQIELILTHFRKFWFLRVPVRIKVGFMFWNEAILFVSRELNIELKTFFEWAKKNQTLYFTEMLYASYLVWCKEKYTKPRFGKKEFIYSFSQLPEDKQKDVMRVWRESESFGVKEEKKKAQK